MTSEGLAAIEEAIFAGIPINVTLLFSRTQDVAAAEAYLRGIERRIAAGLNPNIGSVASLFVSRWDVAADKTTPETLHNRLGIAIVEQALESYRHLLSQACWQRIFNEGARAQRLLWASTGTKDAKASDTLYVEALAAPMTVNTMPEATLKAFADHGNIAEVQLDPPAEVIAMFAQAGIDSDVLQSQLLAEGVASFATSWNEMLACIASKSGTLKAA